MAGSAGLKERVQEQPYLESTETEESEIESAEVTAVARCVCCGEGMVRAELPRHSRLFGMVLLVVGLLCAVANLLLGLPIVVIGAYMSVASRSVWGCPACGTVVDRNEV